MVQGAQALLERKEEEKVECVDGNWSCGTMVVVVVVMLGPGLLLVVVIFEGSSWWTGCESPPGRKEEVEDSDLMR